MKKILSLFLAVLLLCFSTITVFSAEENISAQLNELKLHTRIIQNTYNVYPQPGNVDIQYIDDTFEQLRNDTDSVLKMIDDYFDYGKIVTQKMIDESYSLLETSVAQMRIETSELEFLLDICKHEQNIDNYYSDEVWAEFQECLSNGENALNTNASEDEITSVYWDLRYAFNKLCAYNQVVGDVNGDGIVNVTDCTLLSKAVADLTTLNSSQKFVSSLVTGVTTLSVNDVTEIQKYLVREVEINSLELENITDNIFSQRSKTNSLFYNLLYKRYFGRL